MDCIHGKYNQIEKKKKKKTNCIPENYRNNFDK